MARRLVVVSKFWQIIIIHERRRRNFSVKSTKYYHFWKCITKISWKWWEWEMNYRFDGINSWASTSLFFRGNNEVISFREMHDKNFVNSMKCSVIGSFDLTEFFATSRKYNVIQQYWKSFVKSTDFRVSNFIALSWFDGTFDKNRAVCKLLQFSHWAFKISWFFIFRLLKVLMRFHEIYLFSFFAKTFISCT